MILAVVAYLVAAWLALVCAFTAHPWWALMFGLVSLGQVIRVIRRELRLGR